MLKRIDDCYTLYKNKQPHTGVRMLRGGGGGAAGRDGGDDGGLLREAHLAQRSAQPSGLPPQALPALYPRYANRLIDLFAESFLER